MLNLLNWDSPIRVNGIIYANSKSAYGELKDFEGDLQIDLNYSSVDTPAATSAELDKVYIVSMPAWLAKKHGCLTEIRGIIIAESAKAIHFKGAAIFTPTITCRVCGRPLTNELSKTRGIGPICMEKMFGFSYSAEDEADLDEACMRAEDKLFEIWLPKSQIQYREV